MSIKLSSLIYQKFPEGKMFMLCMLALADYANDKGENIYPSVETLSTKIRTSPRTTQRLLADLIKQEYLVITANQFGGRKGATRHYRVNTNKLMSLPDIFHKSSKQTQKSHLLESEFATGDKLGTDGCQNEYPTGDKHDTQYVIKSLEDTCLSATRKRAALMTIDEWINSERSAGRDLISSDDSLFKTECEGAFLPQEYIYLAWNEFRLRNAETGKRQKDWRQTFRNCVRGNWYKLWDINYKSEYFLTTAGKTAHLRHSKGNIV